ncbi:MAG: GxxExxY protein [Deltaproteobacteria bacterium]|nr:GxxExxY protein [Candidatus Brocadiaceae bacterium]MCP4366499.1 GxxExxY protein [Deltaproteobacteria bacterium]
MKLEYEELTDKIIAAAIEVHKALGPGFLESVYENALSIEFESCGVPYEKQWEMPIFYKNREIGKHRLDMFVFNRFVVELKAIKEVTNEHFATVRSYLKAAGQKHGLILNFSKPTLEIKRVIL